jgi:outer membrane protein insertion porin family
MPISPRSLRERRVRRVNLFVTFMLLTLLLVEPHAADSRSLGQPPALALELGAIEVKGVRRYTADEITKVSGLEVGKRITIADLDAATKRMAGTGLFKTVGYHYEDRNGQRIVTFEIEEADWTIPVAFDNFVWFTDAEIIASVRETVLSFDGTAPATAGIPEAIASALQALLKSARVDGRVEFLPQAALNASIETYMFRVVDPSPRLCGVRFDGTSAIAHDELTSALRPSSEAYSRSYLVAASNGTLSDLYRRRGYWRATFAEPVPKVVGGAECRGVSVTITVDEGVPYLWDSAAWVGNTAMSATELDTLLGLKGGDVAGATLLEDGLRRVNRAYATRGYLIQRATYTPRLDDAERRVSFEIKAAEGPQFRLGNVEFVNLPPPDAAALRKAWRLNPGDVYDASYPDRFMKEEIQPRLQGAKAPRAETTLDVKKAVVHVRFVFGA